LDEDNTKNLFNCNWEIGGKYTYDHDFNWASFVEITYNYYGSEYYPYYGLSNIDNDFWHPGISTTKAILTRLAGTAEFTFEREKSDDHPELGLVMNLTYWIL
jgi:hypothetical protein